MNNEELFYLLQKFWPGTINGTHYLTGHRLDTEGKQLGEAFIQYWRLSEPQPTRGQLLDLWAEHRDEIQATIAGVHHRWERAERLLRADALVYRAEDGGDEARTDAARKYRQALRDVPQLPGFPWSFEWPVPPEDDEVQNVARRDAVLREVEDAAVNPRALSAIASAAHLLPPVTLLNVNADGTTGPALPPPEEPMREYGNLESRTPMKPPEQRKPIVPVLGEGESQPIDGEELPHSPGYEESIPPNDGISEPADPYDTGEPPPFMPSPEPIVTAPGQPDVQASVAVMTDPAEKLRAFLAANPDVVTYIEDNTPTDPQP
ncbi:phage tail assembly chaperone [Caballeronia sp. NCTM5]|uniref:XkdW family protein n=1 Tax=Caballeronia sp. NCTM5 TaxID=2921755 RepID=UPI0020291C6A|nr:phage tail assembly chaperone [Caballeronia sp. NCTM5]